ncbi:phytoene desaturase family protein [Jatrophihabitans fulvus]
MARVVVVGAGVGGLAAAVRLAALGHDVTLCEAAPTVGGKLAGQVLDTVEGRFGFDTGPTLLTLPQVFEDLFAATGDPLSSVLPLRRLDTVAHYRFADGARVDTVDDLDRQASLFDAALGEGTGAAWQRVLDRGAAIWSAVEEPVFGRTLSARTVFGLGARLARIADLRAVAPHRTLRSVARELLPDPRQRLMLERYATYEGSDPRRAPAALAVVPYLEQRFGAWYVEGGLHRLAGALADRFAELGGRLRLDTAVTGVGGQGRVSHVELADGRLDADVVVSGVDAHTLYGSLHRTRRPVPPADSLGGVVLLLAVRDALPALGHHTVLFGSAPYDDEFDAIFATPARPVREPVLYLNAPVDAAVAPEGCRAVYVLVNAPRHGDAPGTVDWTAPGFADRYADGLLDQLAGRGLDVRDRVIARAVRTPADLERDTGAPGGAIYGQVQHGLRATLGRAHNRSLTRGLFLVGGSTHPGGGLPLVALSARAVAADIGAA